MENSGIGIDDLWTSQVHCMWAESTGKRWLVNRRASCYGVSTRRVLRLRENVKQCGDVAS